MKENTKVNVTIFSVFIGMIFWGSTGYKYITNSDGFKDMVKPLIGNGLFTIEGLLFAVLFLSLYFYPMIVWMFICTELCDPGSTKKLLFDRESSYIWFFPLFLMLIAGVFLALFVVRSVLLIVVFLVIPLYFVCSYILEVYKIDEPKS